MQMKMHLIHNPKELLATVLEMIILYLLNIAQRAEALGLEHMLCFLTYKLGNLKHLPLFGCLQL